MLGRVTLVTLDAEQHLCGLDVDAFSQRAGHYLGEINAVHPFREGNGRAQQEFIRGSQWQTDTGSNGRAYRAR